MKKYSLIGDQNTIAERLSQPTASPFLHAPEIQRMIAASYHPRLWNLAWRLSQLAVSRHQ